MLEVFRTSHCSQWAHASIGSQIIPNGQNVSKNILKNQVSLNNKRQLELSHASTLRAHSLKHWSFVFLVLSEESTALIGVQCEERGWNSPCIRTQRQVQSNQTHLNSSKFGDSDFGSLRWRSTGSCECGIFTQDGSQKLTPQIASWPLRKNQVPWFSWQERSF